MIKDTQSDSQTTIDELAMHRRILMMGGRGSYSPKSAWIAAKNVLIEIHKRSLSKEQLLVYKVVTDNDFYEKLKEVASNWRVCDDWYFSYSETEKTATIAII